MTNKNAKLVFGLVLLVCACFTTCDWENPVMGKWWVDPEPEEPGEPEYIYVGILKNIPVPQYIYETVIQTVVEEKIIEKIIPTPVTENMILQCIEIIGIEYIIFAGDSRTFNGPPVPPAVTPLSTEEIAYNISIVEGVAKMLKENKDYLVLLHGHANPTDFTQGELQELTQLSKDRADAVEVELKAEFIAQGGDLIQPDPDLDWDDRVSAKGYGGEKTLFGNNSPYTQLNRRVEVILFRIKTS